MKIAKIDTFSGHRDGVYALEKASDYTFFSAGGDGQVVRWNLQKPDLGELIARVPASIYTLAYDEVANELWVAQNFEGIHIINPDTKEELRSIKVTSSAIFDVQLYQINAFIGTNDGTIIVMDKEAFAVKKHIKASEKSVRTMAINPILGHLAVGYSDFSIKIFDLQDFSLKFAIPAHSNSVFTVAYSPDNQFLLSGSRDAHLKIWNVSEGYTLHQDIVAHLFAINHITFSPDGTNFATCSMDKSIKIWDSHSFKLLKVIDKARHAGHGTSVNRLWWSTFQDKLLSASDDKMISVWEIER